MAEEASADNGYSDLYISALQLMWGQGFLSPGGSSEVARITRGLDLVGKTVLDLGSGLGGPSICLVALHRVGRVIGLDLDPRNVQRANETVAEAGLSARIRHHLVDERSFPVPSCSVDLVFSKEALVETEQKGETLREAHRVLRPGGNLLMSDWLCGKQPFSPEMDAWIADTDYKARMIDCDQIVTMLSSLGFTGIKVEDRSDWYRSFCREEMLYMEKIARPDFEQLLGREGYNDWLNALRLKHVVVDQGHIRPTHVRALKPYTRE